MGQSTTVEYDDVSRVLES